MGYNNDYWPPEGDKERSQAKLRPASFLQRNRWIIIIISALVVLVAIFGTTTFYLLSHSQNISKTAPASAQTSAAATENPSTPTELSAQTPTPASNAPAPALTTTSKDYQFICLTSCDNKLSVVLNDITLNTTDQTMAWDFTITDNGDVCTDMYGMLSLQSPSGATLNANGGTFTNNITINANQSLPRTATFSSIPQQKTQYTTNLALGCNYPSATYQAVLFNY